MVLIGIVANKKSCELIKTEILKREKQINVIHITPLSLENMKNIKFETVIIEENLEKFEKQKEKIKKICKESTYVIINTDLNPKYDEIETKNLITCGINQNAIVTISSNSEDDILIFWQKSIENREGNIIEIEERRINYEIDIG